MCEVKGKGQSDRQTESGGPIKYKESGGVYQTAGSSIDCRDSLVFIHQAILRGDFSFFF